MLSLDHVVFPVRDARATLDFYRDVLGLPLIDVLTGDDWDGHAWMMMTFGLGGGQELVTVALGGAPSPDYRGVPVDARHYALAAGSQGEFEAWRNRLKSAGVDVWEERHGARRSIYFSDPDQVILEITWPASMHGAVEREEAVTAARRWIAKAREPA